MVEIPILDMTLSTPLQDAFMKLRRAWRGETPSSSPSEIMSSMVSSAK